MIVIASDASWSPIAVVLIASAGSLAAAILAAHLTLRNQTKLTRNQNRQKAYSAIHGSRVLICQLLASKYEARANSDFQQSVWRSGDGAPDSLNFKEAHRWMLRSETLDLEIAKAKQSLYESIGLAQANFPKTRRFSELSEVVFRLPYPIVQPSPPGENGAAALHAWKEAEVARLHKWIQCNYDHCLLALSEELVQRLDAK